MRKLGLALAAFLVAVGAVASGASSAPSGGAAPGASKASASSRYIVIAPNKAAFNSALSEARSGTRVALTMAPVNAFVVNASASDAQALAKSHRVKVVRDHIEHLIRPGMYGDAGMIPPSQVDRQAVAKRLAATGHATNPFSTPTAHPFDILAGITADAAFGLGGGAPNDPMWSIERINAPQAWTTNAGDDEVTVAVADTGLDYTHDELANKVVAVQDFTTNEVFINGESICKSLFGFDDADLADDLGTPQNLDYNGHGSWIGGNIAAEVNGNSVNGIAPGVSLVALKISQWCGSAFDSEIMAAFIWAAEHGIDVVSISFGGYLDRADPFQDAAYKLYETVLDYVTTFGTTIAASAGNEHTNIGLGGKVMSHGILSSPPGGDDFFGLYEVPGGIKGVVDVSSTNNVVNAPSATCPTTNSDYSTTGAHPYCKPTSDAHQPFGVGTRNQLTYYSNYGKRIDVAAPGGARKFNLPAVDRGGTEGWPFTGTDSYASDNDPGGGESDTGTTDGFQTWEDFSITSNVALEIPCVVFDGSSADPDPDGYYGVSTQTGFDDDQCYSAIQGTSMAAPHASATLALIASAHPELRFDPASLIKFLKKSAVTPAKLLTNTTPPVSATDVSAADLTGDTCDFGYCHLGGKAIKAKDAFGAGLVDAAAAVAGGESGPVSGG